MQFIFIHLLLGVCQPLTYSSDIRCLAAFRHWTYNRDSGECEEFTYGGCGGSANNFPTKEACSQKCGARVVRVTTEAPEPMTPDGMYPSDISHMSRDM